MKIDTTNWHEYKLENLFSFVNCKCSNASNLTDGNDIFYIGAKKNDNGVMKKVAYDESLVTNGNCIVFICDGQGSVGYSNYMEKDFIGSTTLTVGFNEHLNKEVGLFLVSVLDLQRPKYSFGRKYRKHLADTIIKLPYLTNEQPNYEYMENFIKKLHYKKIKTSIIPQTLECLTEKWKEYKISDIFNVKSGSDLELINCTMSDSENSINFVARTSQNNGVIAKVETISNLEPIKAGSITCAVGGSVLSTFLQDKDFYTGFHVKILTPKYEMSKYSKLFCVTVIKANKYRFNYGRQANKSLPDLIIKLPTKSDNTPDFDYMENYIKSLPYSDKI